MRVQCMIRSANRELCALLSGELTETGRAFGAAIHTDSDYPGMVYRPESAMREQLAEIVREEFGQPLTERSTHGGMEVGYLAEHLCDVVTLGPELEGCHSPSERMHLGSFNRVYSVLTRLLERLP